MIDNESLGAGFIFGLVLAIIIVLIVDFSLPNKLEVKEKYIIEIGCATYVSGAFTIKDECKKYYGIKK